MTTTRLCCTLLGLALAAAPTAARDLTGDLPAVGQFLERDKSYAPPDRAQARAALARLQMGAKDMSPAAFQLAVAHIAALARNGHTMLLPGPWAFDFNRTPLRYHLFADGLRVLHAPPEMRELLGARVLAIDGYGVDALRQAFARYLNDDSPYVTSLASTKGNRARRPVTSNARCTSAGPAMIAKRHPAEREDASRSTMRRRPVESRKVACRRSTTMRRNPSFMRSAIRSRTVPVVATSISPEGHTRTNSRSGSTSTRNGGTIACPAVDSS